ncbi:MAG TPA: sugar ABC transporter ATP-binding protein [Geminicoccus sp.]|uniref:sugar ABC transporter ATP-binding protein n=1 Tax=Geminicoccus sp. TaxID=2024832 RepID=UPI002BF513C8|nr:sugar ABC transporter ATP-binding protein [Geminicoccus sp.]HWL69038.1 sugar ABC transporter ATP-binding protein [Geminicoccus sp.]
MSEGKETPILEMVGIGKRFGGVTALTGIDFDLRRGEVHGLVGENGAGKSTLMKIIAGVHHGYDGEMRIDGQAVNFRSARDALAAGIGMVHQELSIVPQLSVAENVFLGVQPTNGLGVVSWGRMKREAREHLQLLGIDIDPTRETGTLPIGMQQLIEIGRVLFSGARIVILDEPTSALSPPEVKHLFEVLGRLKAKGTTFVFISHFLEDILEVSDRVTVFRNSRKVATVDAASVDKAWVIEQMIGAGHHELADAMLGEIRLESPKDAPVMFSARGLSRPRSFTDVSFDVKAGEVVGLYGFMGSGQTELARALMGKARLHGGTVSMGGQEIRLRSTADAKKAGIALVPESRRAMLFGHEPVYKNISISILERISRLLLKPGEERRIAQGHVDALRIRPFSVEPEVRKLSGGNQQKVALARWLTHLPRLLVLSEPTKGMDVGAKDDVVKIVKGLKEKGVAVVVASAEPETVLTMADRILVMRKGQIAQEFAERGVSKDQLLAAA